MFGVLDIHNLLFWVFEVDEITWHKLIPALDGSNSLHQISGLNNGKGWHDDPLIVSLRGALDNISLCYIPVVIACWNIHAEVALLQSKQIHCQGQTWCLWIILSAGAQGDTGMQLYICYSTSYDNNTCFLGHDKHGNSIEVDEWTAQNLWNFWRPTRGWRDVLHNIWKHLTLVVFCVGACRIRGGRISGMPKVMERWRSHLLQGLALGTGQLDGVQQEQALSIGFKCPPSWFNSLAWQAPLCGAGKYPVPLYWIGINSKLLKMVENILWTARDSALKFQGSTRWFSSFLGSPDKGSFPGLRVGHGDEVMVCVGGRSVIFCHCHTSLWSREGPRDVPSSHLWLLLWL